jgi:hypothetical protein
MHGRLGAVAAQGGAAAVGEMRRRSEGGAGAAPTPRREGTRAWGRRGQRWEAGREMRSQASGVSSVSSARFFLPRLFTNRVLVVVGPRGAARAVRGVGLALWVR